MFKQTNSIVTNSPLSTLKNKQQMNLIRSVKNRNKYQQHCDQIHTFEEFKQAINKYDFQKNQQQVKSSAMVKPKFSLPPENNGGFEINVRDSGNQTGFNKERRHARRSQSLDLGYGGFGEAELGGFLGIVNEELHSRSSAKRSTIQQKANLATGLDLTYDLNTYKKIQEKPMQASRPVVDNQQLLQSASMYKSSAHSSRSFNGNEQINQYEIIEKLGAGGFSTVHLCKDVHTGLNYAMKVVKKKQVQKKLFRKNSYNRADSFISNQIALLKKMDHPHVIKLFEVIEDDSKKQIYMILEYCEGGFINQPKDSQVKNERYSKLPESVCKEYYKQIAQAMDYIHNIAKIAHRDIKPENILLTKDGKVKISDFGLGTDEIQVSSKSGTMGYMPPEAKNKSLLPTGFATESKFIAQMADMWALGITLLVLLTGKNPELDESKLQSTINALSDVSEPCKDVLRKLLTLNPKNRITSPQLIQHPWIQAKKQTYAAIEVSPEQTQQAISKINRDILIQITKMNLQSI